MTHAKSGQKVIADSDHSGCRITLLDYGDADYLEDQLIERCNISNVERINENMKDGIESFILFIPNRSADSVQHIIDQIE